ncbi:hypothetical protein [Aeromonas caviae]|uniref:hypothetical protein n=1 Tax=Aeromonas caviae TaxID=648 RepID=UPI0030146708
MSNYERFIKSISDVKSTSSHITALGKIRNSTEDDRFKSTLDELIKGLQLYHSRSKSKSTPISLENSTDKVLIALKNYCEKNISTKKPEWQILAERHGWGPK